MNTNEEQELKRIIKKGKVIIHMVAELERELEQFYKDNQESSPTPEDRRDISTTEEQVTINSIYGSTQATIKYKDGEKPSKSTREGNDLWKVII